MKEKSRILIISIPLVIILSAAVFYEYVIEGVREEAIAVNDMKMTKIKTLQKYTDAIEQKSNLEKQISIQKENRKNEDVKIITAQTLAIATANLQDSVKGIISGRGGIINSEKVEKPDEYGKFKIINVVLDVIFPDVRALSDTLFTIETQTPYMVVKELDVRVRNNSDPREMIVKLKVTALTGG